VVSRHVPAPPLTQPLFSSSASTEQVVIPAPSPATHLRQKDYSLPVWPDDVVHLGPHPLPGQLGCTQACLKHGVKTVKALAKHQNPESCRIGRKRESHSLTSSRAYSFLWVQSPSQANETFMNHNLELFL